MARARRAEAHVRLYAHELECAAYRSLSPVSRALLVEMRSLYDGRDNRIYMSIREAMQRLGVGRRQVERALAELIGHGWIRVIKDGSFDYKIRHATEYALENQPLNDCDGAVAPKSYMRWTPA